jgi:hypothetical protein
MKADHISALKRQIQMYGVNLQKTKDQLIDLQNIFATSLESNSTTDHGNTPFDRIFADIVQNHSHYPNSRRYSRETLLWTRHVYEISPQAWKAVRKALPLPGKRSLLSEFLETGMNGKALLDMGEIGRLLELWKQVVPDGLEDRYIRLSVDAIAFRPLVTPSEDGTIDGLMTLDC